MVEQRCPQCRATNPIQNRYCGQCGSALNLPVARQSSPLVIGRPNLPAPELKQIGQTVAVGLLAIAAEAGLSWLRRRVQRESGAKLPVTQDSIRPKAIVPQQKTAVPPTAVYHSETIEHTEMRPEGILRRVVTRAAWWESRSS